MVIIMSITQISIDNVVYEISRVFDKRRTALSLVSERLVSSERNGIPLTNEQNIVYNNISGAGALKEDK